MNKTVKLITAITGLLVAIGTLVGAITVTLAIFSSTGQPVRGSMMCEYFFPRIV